MKNRAKKLNDYELKQINEEFEPVTFNNEFDFVYEEQVPNTAILLTDGELTLYKKNKLLEVIDPGHLLGAYQLLHNEPVKFTCKVGRKSKVILLDKSTLLAATDNPSSPLSTIVNDLKNKV